MPDDKRNVTPPAHGATHAERRRPAQQRPHVGAQARGARVPPHASHSQKSAHVLQRKPNGARPANAHLNPAGAAPQKSKPVAAPSASAPNVIKPSRPPAPNVGPPQTPFRPIQRKTEDAPKNAAPRVIIPPRAAAKPPAAPLAGRPSESDAVQLKPPPGARPQQQTAAGGVVQLAKRTRRGRLLRQGLDPDNIIRPRRDYLGNAQGLNSRSIPRRKKWRVARYMPGAPHGYRDVPFTSPHANLRGIVWVRPGPVRLWWLRPRRQIDGFVYRGSRALDIAYCNANYESAVGYTWHHCADYAGGVGTMQLVPTAEHASWGHYGGVEQAHAAGVPGY